MVAWHVVVLYDENEVVFDGFVEAINNIHAHDEVECIMYDEGLVNPYLFEVSQKLDFNIERVQ